MKVSVITPSRLAVNPNSEHGNLWLDLALMSVRRQTVFGEHEIEMVVGLDPGAPEPPDRFSGVIWAVADAITDSPQACAVNAAVNVCDSDILAFLEDDDTWEPTKLAHQLPLLEHFDFVSSNQREMDEDRSTWLRTNDFPTPSGWLMRRSLWDELGGFNETFQFHVDTQFLGKLNAAKKKRVHVVERNPDWSRQWLHIVARRSLIAESTEQTPLVVRTVNSKGGMARIAKDPEAAAISQEEHRRMVEQFGEVPW